MFTCNVQQAKASYSSNHSTPSEWPAGRSLSRCARPIARSSSERSSKGLPLPRAVANYYYTTTTTTTTTMS